MSDAAARLVLDGNAIAGLLEQLFGADMTAMPRRCAGCGQTHEIGRHRLYRGAGIVLRCPGCGAVAAMIAQPPGRAVVRLSGTWALRLRG